MHHAQGFHDDFNRNLASAIWTLPTAEDVLVYRKAYGGGFLLYQQAEWNAKSEPGLEADQDGCVLRAGQYVGYRDPAWTVPQTVRDRAIGQ